MKLLLFITLVSFSLGIWAIPRQSEISRNGMRIVGGCDASIEDYPYIAQLYVKNKYNCGAAILSETWIITAGHCAYGRLLSEVTIRVGSSKFNQTDNKAYSLARGRVHPMYNSTTFDYDISLLQLNESLTFGTTVATISLPSANVVLSAGSLATVLGWGYLNFTTQVFPTQLQVVQVPTITNEECARRYNNTVVIVTDRVLCAGYEAGGKDACVYDSGSPLAVDGTLYGLVSNGIGCADPRYPGTYTNVSNLRSYIEEITGL